MAREAVAHFQWSESPREPWRGVSPLAAASKLGTLAGRVEGKLAEDLACPTAYVLPVPSDGGSPKLDALRADIAKAEGAALLLEGTSGRMGRNPRADRHAERLESATARTGDPGRAQRDVERRAVSRRRCLWHPGGTLGPWGGWYRSERSL